MTPLIFFFFFYSCASFLPSLLPSHSLHFSSLFLFCRFFVFQGRIKSLGCRLSICLRGSTCSCLLAVIYVPSVSSVSACGTLHWRFWGSAVGLNGYCSTSAMTSCHARDRVRPPQVRATLGPHVLLEFFNDESAGRRRHVAMHVPLQWVVRQGDFKMRSVRRGPSVRFGFSPPAYFQRCPVDALSE